MSRKLTVVYDIRFFSADEREAARERLVAAGFVPSDRAARVKTAKLVEKQLAERGKDVGLAWPSDSFVESVTITIDSIEGTEDESDDAALDATGAQLDAALQSIDHDPVIQFQVLRLTDLSRP